MSINRRSKNINEGVARAPNRSMYYAMGYTDGDFGKPMIGVANGHSTITPCNSGLQRLADAAVIGLKEAGANPQIFGLAPASFRPITAASARRCRPLLQGVMVLWPLATPIIGLPKSPSV